MPANPIGLQPSAFSSSQANRTLLSDLSILKPQYYPQFIQKYGAQNYTQLLEMIGMKAVVPSKFFRHFESSGKLHSYVKVAATALTEGASPWSNANGTIAAGEGAVVTLDSGSVYLQGSKYYNPTRVGEVVENLSNGYQFKIVAVSQPTGSSTHTITVVPLDATQDINSDSPLPIAQGDYLVLRGTTEAGEASSKFNSINSRISEITGSTTEIREDWSITDRAKIEEIWFEYNGQPFYTYKGLDEAVRRFMNNKEFKLMFGQPNTNSLVDSSGATGLVPQIISGGQNTTFSGTSFGGSDFQAIGRRLDFNGGSEEYHFLVDRYLRDYIDLKMFDEYKAGGIIWANVGGSAEVAAQYGFDSLKISGTTYHIKKYLPLNGEAVYGLPSDAADQYKESGMLIPMKEGRDAKTGDKVPSVRIVYNEVEPGKEVKIWETGALAKTPTSDKMELNVHHMAYCGLQVFGINQFGRVKKA